MDKMGEASPVIPVYEPTLGREELENVVEAVKSSWISSKGKFIPEFEDAFAEYCGVKYGVTCSNGTAALHLALAALGIRKGDEVLVPTLTFVATANVVVYTGAKPVFVDSDHEYWCIDPERIREAVNKRVKAMIPVHLYGHPCDMGAVMKVAEDNGLFVVEDAAEAHGGEYKGWKVGGIGDVGCFSFYGNKILTTGEGGMCVTDNEELADKMRILRDHGMNPHKKYWHDIIGFNYRMTNIHAAIGVAQLKKIDTIIEKKRRIAEWYRKELREMEGLTQHPEMPWAKNVYWMYSILVEKDFSMGRDELIRKLRERGVDTRPFFHPIHELPMYRTGDRFPISEELASKGVNLPSSANLSQEDVSNIAEKLRHL